MKLVFITHNIAITDEVLEVLEKLGLKSYTRWDDVTGVGTQSGPHLNTHIWPARNSVVADDDKANMLMSEIRRLRRSEAKEGIKAFSLPVEDVT